MLLCGALQRWFDRHMLKLMDETVSDEMGYTLVVCYTEVTDDNVPPMAWIREVYDMLPRKCVAVKLVASVTNRPLALTLCDC